MTKKTILIILTVLALVLVCACTGENYNSFKPLTMPTGSAVVNNGGLVVRIGEYTYFVNGVVAATGDNTYNKVTEGAICRIKTDDIMKEKPLVEIVVPKICYQGEVSSTGLFVKKDRIYFTTPSVEKNNNGEIKNSELQVMSAKFDGSGVEVYLSIPVNTIAVYLMDSGEGVYCVYLNGDKVMGAQLQKNAKATELAKDITAIKIDGKDVYMTQKIKYKNAQDEDMDETYNKLLKFSIGGKVVELLDGSKAVANVPDIMYALVTAADGKIYYTATGAVEAYAGTFVYDTKEKRLSQTANTSILPYKEGFLMVNGSFVCYITYNEETKVTTSTKMIYTSSWTPKFIVDNYAYYVNSNILYKAELNEEKISEGKALHTTTMTATTVSYDVIGTDVFFVSSANSKIYVANFEKVEGKDDKIVETLVAYVVEEKKIDEKN
ncbi:MAG: hypothetical protein RR054_05160 [Clostridia bacterium]